MTKHSSLIPNYIKAGTPEGLRLLMYKTNAKHGLQLQYFDIQQITDGNGKFSWIAWFYINLESIGDLENGNAVELSGSRSR